jgi:hypothetical protein
MDTKLQETYLEPEYSRLEYTLPLLLISKLIRGATAQTGP